MGFSEPLILPFLAVALGVLAAHQFPVSRMEAAAAGAIAATLAGIALRYAPRAARLACLTALAFAGIAIAPPHQGKSAPLLSVPDNVPAILDGCVVEPALLAADRERFTVELAPGARAEVSLFARPDEKFLDLPYGTRVEFTGKIRTPHNYNNPGSFDMAHYLARQRIYWNISADSATVHVLNGGCGHFLARFIYGIRTFCLARLDSLYARDAFANGMMQAILIGATAKLDRMWTEDYRSTGTFHALVISGGHVAVIAAVFLFFLRILGAPRGIAIVLTLAMAWLYAGVTGWQAPVLRSAAGMSLFGIARSFYREGRLLNILAATALFFVVFDAGQLFDASFQLSFLAVALIGAFVAPALEKTSSPLASGLSGLADHRRDIRLKPAAAQFRVEMRLLAETLSLSLRVPRVVANGLISGTSRIVLYVWDIFVTSLFIQIGLALPMIFYFHRASISGLSANAIVVPLLGLVVPLGFGAIALNSALLAKVCAGLLAITGSAVSLHAHWEPDWRIPAPPLWLAAIFLVALTIAAIRGSKRSVRAAAWTVALLALAVIIAHPFDPRVTRGSFEMSAIDVGQGDSLLCAFPDGKLVLVDAGGIPSFGRLRKPGIDIGEDVVSPYLWSRSIKRLDVVVMTHAHEDHMGGMNAVLKNFRPRELWAGATPESPEWNSVRETAHRLGIPIRHLRLGDSLEFGGTKLQVLAPFTDYLPTAKPNNNDSLVMRVQFRDTAFLLAGDMEKSTEERLFYSQLLSHADVLKVGHHGSRTSTTDDLLDAIHPAFGVISDGFENSYGHPHPLTIQALNDRHIAAYRTDQHGLIRVISDGRRIQVE